MPVYGAGRADRSPNAGCSLGVWDRAPCMWHFLCKPMETTFPTGVWDRQRRARSRDGPSLPQGTGAREGCGSLERGEIFRMRVSPRRFTPVGRSRCGAGGAERGPGAGRFARCLGPPPLCVVSLVQANANDIPDRCLGPAAESTFSGTGRPCHRAPGPGRAADR